MRNISISVHKEFCVIVYKAPLSQGKSRGISSVSPRVAQMSSWMWGEFTCRTEKPGKQSKTRGRRVCWWLPDTKASMDPMLFQSHHFGESDQVEKMKQDSYLKFHFSHSTEWASKMQMMLLESMRKNFLYACMVCFKFLTVKTIFTF
jgi:hypothetical protein